MGIEKADADHPALTNIGGGASPQIISNERATLLAASLQALSSSTRLRLLSVLVHTPDGEATVSQLTKEVDLKQPTVTRHMNVLHDCGVVEREHRGRGTWYRIVPNMREMIEDLVL